MWPYNNDWTKTENLDINEPSTWPVCSDAFVWFEFESAVWASLFPITCWEGSLGNMVSLPRWLSCLKEAFWRSLDGGKLLFLGEIITSVNSSSLKQSTFGSRSTANKEKNSWMQNKIIGSFLSFANTAWYTQVTRGNVCILYKPWFPSVH